MASSQWTIPKLVTWRVKDWASCFLACKIPLDEDGVNSNGNTTSNNSNLTFKRIKRKMKSTKKKRSERKLSLSPPGTRHHHLHLRSSSVSPTTSASQHRRLSWPQQPVSDESGFIVFCFDREDGGFDVVKEGKQEKKENESSPGKSPRTVNRKLIYKDQGVGGTEKNNNSPEIKGTEQEQSDNASSQETEDVSCDVTDVMFFLRCNFNFIVHENLPFLCIYLFCFVLLFQKTKEEEEEEIDASDKSSGSNNSDEGRGSFAFPILGVEWMGSPVKMPESDDLSPKKQKPVALGFQCCRF
ncbi:PREDICTED: protein BREAKING OF ASYMMETRY IN THE STOMATAL LINEAGE isoform X2 [Camelina sativa]|uniref:Protein BREAKING OF ASYMMETRY IN THE STOMATAL LINEAGE isoform X2 n=1 Tax=Camelina sativa TaxID=90675 RepID=A0ABM0UNV3_CAMSA|nr:PREDICTED: protein BREAKING OF ASYMMETRY IN THE STOMATAL LINEAGE isoform X2 [Camelina sativa]